MWHLRSGLVLLLSIVQGHAFAADAPVAAEVAAQHVEDLNRFRAVRNIELGGKRAQLVLLELFDGGAPRVTRMRRWRTNQYPGKGIVARDLVEFRSGKLRGTGILVTDQADGRSSFSIWLPALRKVRRITAPDPADGWGGSRFSYGDVYLRRALDETHVWLPQATFRGCLALPPSSGPALPGDLPPRPGQRCDLEGRELLRLESRPRYPGQGYERRVSWLDPQTFADYRIEYFRDGRRVKVMDKDWRSMGEADPRALYWLYWYARTDDGAYQALAWVPRAAIRWNQPLKPALWRESRLRRIRR